MKFRSKLLFFSMLLISTAMSITGFLIIRYNFKTALNLEIKNAITENNLLQSSMEQEILDLSYHSPLDFQQSLGSIGQKIHTSHNILQSVFYIRYNDNICYAGDTHAASIPQKLLAQIEPGSKKYSIIYHDKHYLIYTSSCSQLYSGRIYLITSLDITSPYTAMKQQTAFFRLILLVLLIVFGGFLYLLGYLLTKPLKSLTLASSHFAGGDYTARVTIHSHDEIRKLSDTFNFMADTLESQITTLKDMVQQREQFVSDFSHEVKSPLTTIIGYADTLRSRELPRKQQIMAADYIFSEGKRLESMSFKLLDLIYQKNTPLTLQKNPVDALIRRLQDSILPALEEKNLAFLTDCQPGYILGDPELLLTVLRNLVDNARKASKPGDTILCKGFPNNEGCGYFLEIQDFGYGMTKEDLKHVFDEFYMADKSRSRKEGGAGLGLSLVSVILKKHQADFHIQSEPGTGTSVQITFHNTMPKAEYTHLKGERNETNETK